LRQSGNSAVQPGKPGYFEAANYVQKLEVRRASTAPRVTCTPRAIRTSRRSAQYRPSGNRARATPGGDRSAGAIYYQSRYRDFAPRWEAAIKRWEQQAAPLKGVTVVVQHKGFPYLEHWLGLREAAALEPKPGCRAHQRPSHRGPGTTATRTREDDSARGLQ